MMADLDARDLNVPDTAGDESVDTGSGGIVVKKLAPGEVVTSGTGTYTPFLNQNNNDPASQGFNTDDNDATAPNNDAGLDMTDSGTQSIRLGDIPIVFKDFTNDGIDNPVAYYEIRLDINEETNDGVDGSGNPRGELAITELQIYTSSRQATLEDYQEGSYETRALSNDFTLRYDLDAGGDNTILLFDSNQGGGKDDYIFYIPVSSFGDAGPDSYFTLFSQFGPDPDEGATPEEWRVQTTSRINGTKFNDEDGDGEKDANEGGLAGFQMYIDTNNNNVFDVGEISATSDANGNFTFYGLLAGNYIIREVPNGDWINTTGDGGDHLVTITTGGVNAQVFVGNFLADPEIRIEKEVPSITGGVGGPNGLGGADNAGDVINYDLTVTNIGNLGLTNIVVTDDNADPGSILATSVDGDGTNGQIGQTYNVGDTDFDQVLDPGEIWEYTAKHTVTQDDLDSYGDDSSDGPDNDVDNTAGVTGDWSFGGKSGQVSDTDSEDAPLLPNPDVSIVKVFTGWEDGEATGNAVGDKALYTVTVTNEGNITLTGVVVNDPLTGAPINVGTLAPGAVYEVDTSYTITQQDLDTRGDSAVGNDDADGDIDNTATVTTNETDPESDSAEALLTYNPSFTVEKAVSFDGITFDDADEADGPQASILQSPIFLITIANTGNVTLTGFTLSDVNYTFDAVNGTPIDLSGVPKEGDTDNDGDLDVGETWTLEYGQPLDIGYHKNTVTVEFDEAGPQSDDAFYYVLANDGPGVRTPGFWQNPKNGGTFWDGKPNNQAHEGDTFPDGDPETEGNQDLLYVVDTNCNGSLADEAVNQDGSINTTNTAKFGLLIGDYNKNGITDDYGKDGIAGTADDVQEDTIFISYKDAQSLISASNKQGNDVTYTIGRDVVATWLNYLGGNNIDPLTGNPAEIANAPRHY
ncbi:MAG: SpaA isopeptide-forming pilin-related protein, partial [Tsuneonella sp.]